MAHRNDPIPPDLLAYIGWQGERYTLRKTHIEYYEGAGIATDAPAEVVAHWRRLGGVEVPVPGQVYNTDALTLLRSIPSGSVDLFFADPPYNLDYKYGVHDDNQPDAQYLNWCYSWLGEAVRVLKSTGTLIVMNIPKYAISFGAYLNQHMMFQHWITWNAPAHRSKKPLMPANYALLYYTKSDTFTVNEVRYPHKKCRKCGELIADYGGKKHLIHPVGPAISDVWSDIGRARHRERGEHPCKLPDRLVERVLLLTTNKGDLVIDPFVGTGTTAVVARRLDRQYIVGDLNLLFVEDARRRLSVPNRKQLSLFADAA